MPVQFADPWDFGARTTNLDNSAAINAALAVSPVLAQRPEIYSIAAPLIMQPGQRYIGARLTQPNGANLQNFVQMAAGCELDHAMIDGNGANNPSGDPILVKAYGGANDVKIINGYFTGSTGGAIAIANSTDALVQTNRFDNCNDYAVLAFNNSGPYQRAGHLIDGNKISGAMLHAIQCEQVSNIIVTRNKILAGSFGTVSGNTVGLLRANISGGVATIAAGSALDFTGATKGCVLVAAGQEYAIISVISNAALNVVPLAGSPSSMSNAVAAFGSGDLLSFTCTSFCKAALNDMSGGVTGSIVLASGGGFMTPVQECLYNGFFTNMIEYSGNFGIAVESSPTLPVSQTNLTGNIIMAPGRNGAPGAAAIQASSPAGMMNDLLIDANTMHDIWGLPGNWWLTGSGLPGAGITYGANTIRGFANGTLKSGY